MSPSLESTDLASFLQGFGEVVTSSDVAHHHSTQTTDQFDLTSDFHGTSGQGVDGGGVHVIVSTRLGGCDDGVEHANTALHASIDGFEVDLVEFVVDLLDGSQSMRQVTGFGDQITHSGFARTSLVTEVFRHLGLQGFTSLSQVFVMEDFIFAFEASVLVADDESQVSSVTVDHVAFEALEVIHDVVDNGSQFQDAGVDAGQHTHIDLRSANEVVGFESVTQLFFFAGETNIHGLGVQRVEFHAFEVVSNGFELVTQGLVHIAQAQGFSSDHTCGNVRIVLRLLVDHNGLSGVRCLVGKILKHKIEVFTPLTDNL